MNQANQHFTAPDTSALTKERYAAMRDGWQEEIASIAA